MNAFILVVLLVLSLFVSAGPVAFQAEIDRSSWELDASKFGCRLKHSIPSFGQGHFFHEAGKSVEFSLIPSQRKSMSGVVRLVSQASAWQPGVAPSWIADIKPESESGKVLVNPVASAEMLVSLYQGMSPTFTLPNWLGSGESASIALSAANFSKVYPEYIDCVEKLLPVNYLQIARTALLFPPAQWRLSDSTKERLDLIALYVKTDPKVSEIYVDGHSDNAGRRLLNRDLSKQRAEATTKYLISLGLDESMITTRYHGERYPVVPNNSKANRARNRRVTIRLERD